MTVGDVVTTIFAFIRKTGPIETVASLMVVLAFLLAGLFLLKKIVTLIPGRKQFDVGPRFEHYYSHILPAASLASVNLIYAAYGGLVLSYFPNRHDFRWIYQPFNSLLAGIVATGFVAYLAGKGIAELSKALWFAVHWIMLEARGLKLYKADDGEQYRILWLQRNGEAFRDSTSRHLRVDQARTTAHVRKNKLLTETALAALSVVAWLYGPALLKTFYPLLPATVVAFLAKWDVPAMIAWLVLLFAAIPKVVASIAALLDELLFRVGAQYIPGARVLDPKPVRIGAKDVGREKAHGDQPFTPAANAVRDMAAQRRG